MKPKPAYLGRQVLSALLVGVVGGGVFSDDGKVKGRAQSLVLYKVL